jgi:biotin---protein ligase
MVSTFCLPSSDQIVTVESLNKRARILGVTTDFGFLKAVVVDENMNDTHEIITLQPDGNSFDMMQGMITRKVN